MRPRPQPPAQGVVCATSQGAMSAHARQTNAASDLSRRRGLTCRGQLVFTGTNRGSHGEAAMGRPGGAQGERACPSPQEPTDPSELGGPLGLAGLLKSHWVAGGNGRIHSHRGEISRPPRATPCALSGKFLDSRPQRPAPVVASPKESRTTSFGYRRPKPSVGPIGPLRTVW